MKYNEKADQYLDELYASEKAGTWEQKFNVLRRLLGGEFGFSRNLTWEQKTSMLEYDLLDRLHLIELTYL